jgi:uncharacterized membrane protein
MRVRVWASLPVGDTTVIALKWMYIAFGLMLVLAALPFAACKVKPNLFYGYRTPRTMADESLWYDANCYAARWFAAVGVLVIVTAFGIGTMTAISARTFAETISLLMLMGLACASLMSVRHLRKLL